ncbi:MAG: hypothetical protein FJ291_28370 [Planctomycetes bacterium]|nr:hypothetical protein [Planctomycetota bacterium]
MFSSVVVLARHHQRWAHQLKFARPIEQLLPGETPEIDRPEVLKREILRLTPSVKRDLARAMVSSTFAMTRDEPKFDSEKCRTVLKETTRTFDVVGEYSLLNPTDPWDRDRQQYFELLMGSLEQGIGFFTEARRAARLRKFNPVCWLAFVLRFPILVLEKAGLQSEETESGVLKTYGWLVRLVMVILLASIAAKLGVSIPWQEIGSLFR